MKRTLLGALAILGTMAIGSSVSPARGQASLLPMSTQNARAFLDRYCVRCHNEGYEVGQNTGVMWEKVDLNDIPKYAETLERGVRKLRAGMMPPVGQVRPDLETYSAFRQFLEDELDRNAVTYMPPPGLHRLNRTEYENVIRDLLGLEIDASTLLPADDSSSGFDNMAGTLGLSPTLLEAYLSAAAKISRLAMGTVTSPSQTVYRAPQDGSQDYHIEGLPFGTRGGMLIRHEFPADGIYEFRIVPINQGNMGNTRPFGEVEGEQLEVMLDGTRLELFDWDTATRGRGGVGTPTVRVPVTAGIHDVGVTFPATNYAPSLDFDHKFMRSTIETGGLPGMTFYPHVGAVRISGPFEASGATDTSSRDKIFVCHPNGSGDEETCAREIVSTLARRAFRRPPAEEDLDTLMTFYERGHAEGGFERGIEVALQRILAEPRFIYRIEGEPARVAAGERYPISDLELASRLSFFIWSTGPDDELIDLAAQGRLRETGVLEQQVRRMLADDRARALTTNFAGQWLGLRALEAQSPITALFPDFDDNLRQAMRTETEMFFESILRENRPIADLLTADYTFLNERLAKHYGIPNVYGSEFRRVTLGEEFDNRRGLLGKGAILTITSKPERTSPVTRGKWILQNIMGSPAPDPPPGVVFPTFKTGDASGNAAQPSMRQQMQMHATVPPCSTCHLIMDPLGFALEGFDAIGRERTMDGDVPVDLASTMYDGVDLDGPRGLRETIVARYSDSFVRTATEKLLTYALGRGTEYYDMPVVRSIMRDAASENYTIPALVMAVVKSEPFQTNQKIGPEGPDAAESAALER